MYKQYLKSLRLVSDQAETTFIIHQKRTCYSSIYPFKFFPPRELEYLEFAPITIFYGGNGSGKSTLLNVIAEKLGILRHSAFSCGAFFGEYVSMCESDSSVIPAGSQILTSDDVFDYMLNIRYLNDGIDGGMTRKGLPPAAPPEPASCPHPARSDRESLETPGFKALPMSFPCSFIHSELPG